MAEFLIKAKNGSDDKGSIIVVRPDGWEWGRLEGPPDFVVVQCPEITIGEGKLYEAPLLGENDEVIKSKKYYIDISEVDKLKLKDKGKESQSKKSFKIKAKTK